MRWVWLLVFLVLTPSALAVTITCGPNPVEAGETITVTVNHDGATQVRVYYQGAWHEKAGSSASWHITETAGTKSYLGDANEGSGWLGENKLCSLTVTEATPDALKKGSGTFKI